MRTITVPAEAVQQAEGDAKGYVVQLPDSVVTEDELKKNFVPTTDHEALQRSIEERVNKAVGNAKGAVRGELLKDDAFLTEAAKSRKDFFTKLFPGADVDLEQVRTQFHQEQVKPLEEKLEGLTQENQGLKGKAVAGEIGRALVSAGVNQKHQELISDHLTLRVRWSDKHGAAVVHDAEGKPMERVVNGQMQPVTPTEYLVQLRKEGKFADAFDSKVRGGGGFAGEGDEPANLDDRIAALEREGKFAEAAQLKAQKLEQLGKSAGW